MDVTITRASLHHALRLAARAVPARSTLPILQHFLLEAGSTGLTVSATDTEVAVVTTAAAEVTRAGHIAVGARLLEDYVGHLPDEPVRLALAPKRSRLEVRCARFSAGFATADPDDFPTLLPADGGAALAFDAKRLRDAIQRVVFAAARDEQRPVLATMLVRGTGDGLLFAAADGFRLARTRLPGTGLPTCEALVPARAAGEMSRLLNDASVESAQLLFAPSGRSVQLRVGGTTLFVRLAEGTFPDLDRVIPSEAAARITVETAVLRQAVGAVSLFGGSSGGRPVRIEAGGGKLRLLAHSAETGDAQTELPVEIRGTTADATADGTADDTQVVTLSTPLVVDTLAAATARQLELSLNGSTSPVLIREVGDDTGSLWLVMPMHTVGTTRAAPPAAAVEDQAEDDATAIASEAPPEPKDAVHTLPAAA